MRESRFNIIKKKDCVKLYAVNKRVIGGGEVMGYVGKIVYSKRLGECLFKQSFFIAGLRKDVCEKIVELIEKY